VQAGFIAVIHKQIRSDVLILFTATIFLEAPFLFWAQPMAEQMLPPFETR